MIYLEIEALLRQKIGLDPNSIGSDAIARAIQQRMVECQITNINTYLHKIQTSPQEWDLLIDNVIIPETWFFRDKESFKYLQQYVLSEWIPNHKNTVLRVLSVPCSTGEEPYSIAISLLAAGLDATQFHIDAVDISKKCLLIAQTAKYHQYSFRGNPISFQEQYFQPHLTGFYLHEKIKSTVNFIHGNLATSDFLLGTPTYDIIFCRNLLIYFDITTKKRTIRTLERLLNPTGLLFVGHAESALLLNYQFSPVNYSLAFAHTKSNSVHSLIKSKYQKISHLKNHVNTSIKTIKENSIKQQTPPDLSVNKSSPEINNNLLEIAQILADQGHTAEAIRLCNDYVKQNKVCVEAYVLLGQLYQATGNNQESLQCFQKAIYLQPTHRDALTHLALLQESQGDIANASLLWQRIQRLQNS